MFNQNSNDNCVVYFHRNLESKEVFYVGISNNMKRPFNKSDRSQYWKRYTNKHPYEVEIVHNNLTWEAACELEKQYIQKFGRKDLGFGALINQTDGGDGTFGMKPTPETKEKIRQAKLGKKMSPEAKENMRKSALGKKKSPEAVEKTRQAKLGKKMSSEAKENMRKSALGKKMSPEAIEKTRQAISKEISQFSKDGLFIRNFSSTVEANRLFGFDRSVISNCLNGRKKTCGGFVWRYADK